MCKRFEHKVAIVTGAASGIGFAITVGLLNEGAFVVGADINEEGLRKVEKELGEHFLGVKADVAKEADHEDAISKTVDRFGRLDYAFNVAGDGKMGAITELSEEDWKFTVDICLTGIFLGMKHQARQMKKQKSGVIVNVSSLNAHIPLHSGSAYASSKAGVEMLTKNGALEFAPYNIRVNAILPGLVVTPATEGMLANSEIKNAYMERIPLKRGADPAEMVGPSLFLVSDDASYISGISLLVDGGWSVSNYPDSSRWFK